MAWNKPGGVRPDRPGAARDPDGLGILIIVGGLVLLVAISLAKGPQRHKRPTPPGPETRLARQVSLHRVGAAVPDTPSAVSETVSKLNR
jgi:hypothetical protein